MSNATMAAEAAPCTDNRSTTCMPATTADDSAITVPAAPGCEAAGCVCSAEVGHVFGGLPYVLEVTVSVAGMPPIVVAECNGKVGKVVAGPAFFAPAPDVDGVVLEGAPTVVGVRSLEVVAPTSSDVYRAAAGKLAEMAPEMFRIADELDAEQADGKAGDSLVDAVEAVAAEVPVAGCCREAAAAAQAARCPGGTGPLAEGDPAADEADTDERTPV